MKLLGFISLVSCEWSRCEVNNSICLKMFDAIIVFQKAI